MRKRRRLLPVAEPLPAMRPPLPAALMQHATAAAMPPSSHAPWRH